MSQPAAWGRQPMSDCPLSFQRLAGLSEYGNSHTIGPALGSEYTADVDLASLQYLRRVRGRTGQKSQLS